MAGVPPSVPSIEKAAEPPQSILLIGWIENFYLTLVSEAGICHLIPPTNSNPMMYREPERVQLRTDAEPCNASSFALTVTTVRAAICESSLTFKPVAETSMHSPLREQGSPRSFAHIKLILQSYVSRFAFLRSPM